MFGPEGELLRRAAELIEGKKGERLVVVDLRDASIPTSFFLIADGENPIHVRAMAEELLAKMPIVPQHTEGMGEGRWVLLDYGDFVVHLFHKEARAFYDLEGLWSDREVRPWPPLRPSAPGV